MSRTPPSYFARQYADRPDPWGFEARWYEQRKYALTMASLPRPRYRSAFEPGCSIGVLTELLAERCDRVLAVDLVPSAVDAARRRLAGRPGVEVRPGELPEEWPAERFDLLVLSEVAYYYDEAELRALLAVAETTLEPGATVVAVHWQGETDYPLTGAETHRVLASALPLHPVARHVEDEFLLDVWEYRP